MKKLPAIIFLLINIIIIFAFVIQANEAISLTTQARQTHIEAQELHQEILALREKAKSFNPNKKEESPPVIKADKLISIGEYEITYYCSCSLCCGKSDGITASGTKAVEGITVGADTKILPFGSVIYIEGLGERNVQDRGGAIKGNKLDVYVESHEKALKMGRHKSKVFLIEKDKFYERNSIKD